MSSYIDHHRRDLRHPTGWTVERSWHAFTRSRLQWLYPDQDRSAEQRADLARWNSLGREKAA